MAAREKRTPEDVVAQLRAIRTEFEEIKSMTFAERRELRNKMRMSEERLQQSVSVVGASDMIANAIGRSAGDVVEIFSDRHRWSLVEVELRSLLNGVSSANLRRRYELELIAAQTYGLASQLARNPKNEGLVSFVEEMQRLRKLERRRKKPAVESDSAAPTEPEES